MNKTISAIIKLLSLTPLIGLVPVYILWACETYHVNETLATTGYSINYRDPKVYSVYFIVAACMNVATTFLIPSALATVAGCIISIKEKSSSLLRRLSFYLIPVLFFVILMLNFAEKDVSSILGAFV